MNSTIRNGLMGLALLGAALGAQAQSFDIGGMANKLMNSGAMPTQAVQMVQNQARMQQQQQVQAPTAKKVQYTQQAPQNQQPKSELGAAGDQVLGGVGGLVNGTGDIIGGTAKAGVAAVKTVAGGIGGFFSNLTNQTPDFTVQNYQKIVDGIDSTSKTEIKRGQIENKVGNKKQTIQTETYVLRADSNVVYGLTIASNGQASLEVVGHPKFKTSEGEQHSLKNEHGYAKIQLSGQDAQILKTTFVNNMRTDPANKLAPAVEQPQVPSWGSNSIGG